jgi:hypothetical protein
MRREGGSEGEEEEEGGESNRQTDRGRDIINGKRKDLYDGAFSVCMLVCCVCRRVSRQSPYADVC